MLPDTLAGNELAAALDRQFSEAITAATNVRDELTFLIKPEAALAFCGTLRQSFGFERVSGITCVDYWPRSPRFELIYLLHSIRNNRRIRLKVALGENEEIESVAPIWRGANWYEREVFDLFGITFRNHPNLERILMPPDWEGYPLRKDYPVHGHKYSYQDE